MGQINYTSICISSIVNMYYFYFISTLCKFLQLNGLNDKIKRSWKERLDILLKI